MSVTLRQCVEMTREFHREVLKNDRQQKMMQTYDAGLVMAGDQIVAVSQLLQQRVNEDDKRLLRSHLIAEETGELLKAMGQGDVLATFDGLIDLLYVLLGSAETMDFPIEEGFVEVHRSNMTKQRQPDDPFAARVRAKGPNYKAPNLAPMLRDYYQGG